MTTDSFKEIVMPLQSVMYRTALRIMGNQDDALDAIQDTLARLWNCRSMIEQAENKSAYCIGALRKQCLTALRSQKITTDIDSLSGEPDDCNNPSDALEARDRVDLLRQIIRTLPPTQRRIIELSLFAQLSNAEICRSTGLTDQNVRTALSRARQRIRLLFTQNDK